MVSFFFNFSIFSVDVWSVACIMAELRNRAPLFKGGNHIHQIQLILNLLGKPDEEFMKKINSPEVSDLFFYLSNLLLVFFSLVIVLNNMFLSTYSF